MGSEMCIRDRRQATPRVAAATLVPVCIGAGLVSYNDTASSGGAQTKGTTSLGVVFAVAGVMATAIYTVWIKKYHAVLDCTSMQLLLNQAPVSVLAMLYIIPFSDDVTVWHDVGWSTLLLILFVSGLHISIRDILTGTERRASLSNHSVPIRDHP